MRMGYLEQNWEATLRRMYGGRLSRVVRAQRRQERNIFYSGAKAALMRILAAEYFDDTARRSVLLQELAQEILEWSEERPVSPTLKLDAMAPDEDGKPFQKFLEN